MIGGKLGSTPEDVLVEAFVAKFAVEALDEGILHRRTWLDVAPVETTNGLAQDCAAG